MEMKIPPSLKHEHGEMRASLAIAWKRGPGQERRRPGRLSRRSINPHFIKEEEYALPPLDALAVLAGGGVPDNPEAIYLPRPTGAGTELAEMLPGTSGHREGP